MIEEDGAALNNVGEESRRKRQETKGQAAEKDKLSKEPARTRRPAATSAAQPKREETQEQKDKRRAERNAAEAKIATNSAPSSSTTKHRTDMPPNRDRSRTEERRP